MTDMSKPAIPEDCADEDHQHPGAVASLCTANKHRPVLPGSRAWFWFKRFEQSPVFLIPLIPLSSAVIQMVSPTIEVKLTAAQRDAVNRAAEVGYDHPATVTRVTADLHGASVLDRLMGAGPSLVLGVVLAFVAYAVWRVEINMTAGGRPFTDKDAVYLGRAKTALSWGWIALVCLELGVLGWLHFGTGDRGGLRGGEFASASGLAVLGLLVLLAALRRVYTKGKAAYEELETIA